MTPDASLKVKWTCAGQTSRCCLVAESCLILATLWTVAHQAPLSMGFPRQEYWSGLLFLCPGDHPDPGTEPISPALAGGFFTTESPGKLKTTGD